MTTLVPNRYKQATQYVSKRVDHHELHCGNPREEFLAEQLRKAFLAGFRAAKKEML